MLNSLSRFHMSMEILNFKHKINLSHFFKGEKQTLFGAKLIILKTLLQYRRKLRELLS